MHLPTCSEVHVLLASHVVAGIKACKTTMALHETLSKSESGAKKIKMYQQKKERLATSGGGKNQFCSVSRYFAHAIISIHWRKVLQYLII